MSTHVVGQADRRQVVVLKGIGYWACVRVEQGGLDWIVISADRVVRQQSKGSAFFGVFRDHLRFMGPVRRAQRSSPGGVPPPPVVFLEVTAEPRIPGQNVWPVVPNNMWQPEQAAIMCAAFRGHAAAVPRATAAQCSGNLPAASLEMLHCGSRAWCWVILAMEAHSSALCMYDRGGVLRRTWSPCTSVPRAARGAPRCYCKGLCLVLRHSASTRTTEKTPSAWLWLRSWHHGSRLFVAPCGLSHATGLSSPMRDAGGWRGSFSHRG